MGWLADAIRKFHDSNEANTEDDIENEDLLGQENDQDSNNQNGSDDNADDKDDDNDDGNDQENNATYNIGIGNTGFVLVNQMIDYINRGDLLSGMCLYEYCSKIYKARFTEEEKETHAKR